MIEQIPRRHGNDLGTPTLGVEQLRCRNAVLDFAAGPDQDNVRSVALSFDKNVGTLRDPNIGLCSRSGQDGNFLATENERNGSICRFDGYPPSCCCFVSVGWTHKAQTRHRTKRRQLLDWLVSRTVFADTDRIVRPGVNHFELADGCDADRTPHVVAENEECAADRNASSVGCHAVHDSAHAMFADAVMNQSAFGGRRRKHAEVFDHRACIAGEIGTAADESRHSGCECVEAITTRCTSCNLFSCLIARKPRRVNRRHPVDTRIEPSSALSGCSDPRRPGVYLRRAATACSTVTIDNVLWHIEVLSGQPENGLRLGDLFCAEHFTVGSRCVDSPRRGVADVATETNETRLLGNGHSSPQRSFELFQVVGDFANFVDVPPVAFEPLAGIVGNR